MNTPDTIKHPDTFKRAAPAGFDGIFDWSWTDGCFSTTITPMDFDGVVERKGNFIIFETKDLNVPIPKGQQYTLESAHRLGCFTILFIQGKHRPECGEVWYPGTDKREAFTGEDAARDIVRRWYQYADKNPRKAQPDLGFLQKQVQTLQAERDAYKERLERVEAMLLAQLDEIRR